MTKSSAMFVAGPPVVKRLGQDLTKQELGGADIQTRAGGVDDAVDTEEEAFECARRFLSYLPSSVYELPPTVACTDDPERAEESLMKAVPRNRRQVYKMRPIIDAVVDKGSFFEINANFGRPIITGLARLEGRAVLLLASDPFHYGGSWTADACQKVVRWVDFAETFHLPVVYLMDCPGFMIGLEAEKAATIRHGVRAMAAVNQTTVPWCTIIVRNAFGVAGVVHQPANRFSMRYAWPSAYWGSLPLEGGIEAAYRADIDAADDPAAKLKEIEDRLNKLRSPFRSAEKFWVEEVIDPRKTRSLLCEFARLAEPIRTPGPPTNMTIGRNRVLVVRSASSGLEPKRAHHSPSRRGHGAEPPHPEDTPSRRRRLRPPRDRQHDQRGDDAERAGDEERRQIGRSSTFATGRRRTPRRRAELMAGKDPAEHQVGALRPEPLRGEPHRRRHGRDPVEAVEHRKQRQAVEREIGERQEQQRQAAQAVIPEQQPAIVVAVRQPARDDGADEIEDAHRGEQARGLHLRNAEIEAHRIRCTWIRPLVLAPQMKKVANRIQNTGTSRHRAAVPSAAAMIGAVFGGGAGSGSVPSSPNGRSRRRSAGRASPSARRKPRRPASRRPAPARSASPSVR
jgi:hypothetical protein